MEKIDRKTFFWINLTKKVLKYSEKCVIITSNRFFVRSFYNGY